MTEDLTGVLSKVMEELRDIHAKSFQRIPKSTSTQADEFDRREYHIEPVAEHYALLKMLERRGLPDQQRMSIAGLRYHEELTGKMAREKGGVAREYATRASQVIREVDTMIRLMVPAVGLEK